MSRRDRKELGIDLMGINGLNSYDSHTSAPRKGMFATHIGQAPVVEDCEPRRIMTGMELEFGKYTFGVRFPCDATVIKVLRKYTPAVGYNSIQQNPLTVVIYEDYYDPHKTVGALVVPEYMSLHQDFGFKYTVNKENWGKLREGALFAKDESLATSPAVRSNGAYGIGIEANVAFMSLPSTIEDGFHVSESFLKRTTPTTYNTLIANWGRKVFPLNIYGDENNYKPFPDIGDKIRDDGLVFALRELDDNLAIADMTPRALRQYSDCFDRTLYGKPGATVVDINVYHDPHLNPHHTPVGMDTQARRYYDSACRFYSSLLDVYNKLKARRGNRLKITPEFNRLLVEAQIYLPTPADKRKLNRVYRLEALDEWRVEVTFETKLKPGDGFKYTNMFGGKGVVCKTVKDEELPVDENGNRADLVIYGGSAIKRMNIGQLYEQFINAASRDLVHRLRKNCGLNPKIKPTSFQLDQIVKDEKLVELCWNELIAYYGIVAPIQVDLLIDDPDHSRHVRAVLDSGLYLYVPPDNPVDNLEMANTIANSRFRPHYGPVTYRDNASREVKTVKSVLIGSMYIIMLEKTGDDWSAVASVKTNHFGVPSKLNNFDKQTTPGRESAVRGLGESETRSYISTVGPEATMEILDQSNNPETHKHVIENIIRAPKPTAITKVVKRDLIPYGGSRPVGFNNHLLECRGVKLVFKPDSTEGDGES